MLGAVIACFGGALTATGANVLAWSSHRQRTEGREFSRMQLLGLNFVCLVTNITGSVLFAVSCTIGGAVATVMPMQTGANLLVNMFWQVYLDLKPFTKSMRVGTLILVCAVAELVDVGPQEPDLKNVQQVEELLAQPLAKFWIAVLVICTVLSAVACYLTKDRDVHSLAKLGSFATAVSILTVIGSSVAKTIGALKGVPLMVACGSWFCIGFVMMGLTLLANAGTDVSMYIPAQLSSQLLINMVTGFCFWRDARYISAPVPYLLVYVLCIKAVYLISGELDIVGQAARSYWIRQSKLSEAVAPTAFGRSVLALLRAWQPSDGEACAGAAPAKDRCAAAWDVLLQGLENGMITDKEMATLAHRLLQEQGCAPTALVVDWIEKAQHFRAYCEHDPSFQDNFRSTLSAPEWEKLQALSGEQQGPMLRSGGSSINELSSISRGVSAQGPLLATSC